MVYYSGLMWQSSFVCFSNFFIYVYVKVRNVSSVSEIISMNNFILLELQIFMNYLPCQNMFPLFAVSSHGLFGCFLSHSCTKNVLSLCGTSFKMISIARQKFSVSLETLIAAAIITEIYRRKNTVIKKNRKQIAQLVMT